MCNGAEEPYISATQHRPLTDYGMRHLAYCALQMLLLLLLLTT